MPFHDVYMIKCYEICEYVNRKYNEENESSDNKKIDDSFFRMV